jgi:hypothetical protein
MLWITTAEHPAKAGAGDADQDLFCSVYAERFGCRALFWR